MSPHSSTRIYMGTQYLYRSDDRGENWRRISPDLSRHLDRDTLPIMGKVWPAGSVALNASTTALSNIVTIDESPVLEGLIYVGTDDGLLQVTEDGGKTWRKVEDFPGIPKWTYVSDVMASPRDVNTVYVAFNNWQRGDYKPYLLKSTDRGRTFTSVAGNLPAKHDVWAIAPDFVNPNLIFAGTEFGLFVTVDGGTSWTQLKGGLPVTQVRDVTIQKRENDVVLATYDPEARERRGARHLRPRLLCARRLQRAARDHPADDGRRGAPVPAAPRLQLHARRHCQPGLRRHQLHVGQLQHAEPADGRVDDLQRRQGDARRREAHAHHHERPRHRGAPVRAR
jgi:hypothetical protein